MIKTGIIMEIKNNKVGIMTSSGEFLYVLPSQAPPKLGNIYSGEVINSTKFYLIRKFAVSVTCIVALLTCTGIFVYNTPVSAVTIDSDSSLKLYVNRWNKIIKVSPLNESGKNLIGNTKLKRMEINDGLTLILDKAKECKLLKDISKNKDKSILIQLDMNCDSDINLDKFQNNLKKHGLKATINSKQKNTKKNKINKNKKHIYEETNI